VVNALASLLLALSAFATLGFADGHASYDRAADPHGFTVFMEDGGWCWFQDPRAVIHDDRLFIGAVRGNDSGPAHVGVYDLREQRSLGTVLLHDNFDHDDHNAPVFHVRPDGSVLAVYARHSRDRRHCYRISDPDDPLKWGKEIIFIHNYPDAGNVTYMNLYEVKEEGKLYNFFRGIEFNPSFITSADHGLTWGEPTHFIESELEGRHRPYVRYAGNKIDTIHVSLTDGHPRQFGNSIYYAAFREGKFHRADGEVIKVLETEGPLRPSEAELFYQGSGEPGQGKGLSAIGSAWTSSISIDSQGRPHIGYSLYLSNSDHRYRLASWNGKKWFDREIAYAGRCLYDLESSYTGLITLDPVDPEVVVISADVDPSTGKDCRGNHEIYRARIGAGVDIESVKWEPVTRDSPVSNLRPLIIRDGDRRVLLWNRGEFNTFTNYQLDTVGLVEATTK
jgi:hypothetical protein